MTPPRASVELVKGTTNVFRVGVTLGEDGAAIDLTGWSNFWCAAKRRHTDADADVIFLKVYFDGVEVIDAEEGIIEVTILPADLAALNEGTRENFAGSVGGLDADLNAHELLTLAITAYPRVRRSNA